MQAEQVFHRTIIAGNEFFFNSAGKYNEFVIKLFPKRLRQIRHLSEGRGTLHVKPAVDLVRSEFRLPKRRERLTELVKGQGSDILFYLMVFHSFSFQLIVFSIAQA